MNQGSSLDDITHIELNDILYPIRKMRTDSSGEITLVYEADTERFHRYKGHKSGKEVTLYVKKHNEYGQRPVRSVDVIVSIEDKPKTVAEVNEERRIEKSRLFAAQYTNLPDEHRAFRTEMLRLAQETNHLLGALLNERTKNNPRRSAKKRG